MTPFNAALMIYAAGVPVAGLAAYRYYRMRPDSEHEVDALSAMVAAAFWPLVIAALLAFFTVLLILGLAEWWESDS